ncbi:MAG: hypothetical protein JXP36_09955 [Bacteroidales bacterium]|nr:hypothetical protein [Bacteroidales bacterium]MBN2819284.1 hypothetical protein [Bacteroidales bacterium]
MKKLFAKTYIIAGALLLIVFQSSCLKNFDEEKQNEENKLINDYIKANGFTDENKLPTGIYLKFYNDTTLTDSAKPVTGNTVLLSFTGLYTDGEIYETTDPELGTSLFSDHYFVYGPMRLKMGKILYGVDTTLRFFSPGDSGTMVIPSNYAWYDYRPVVYHIKLHEVIENDSLYEESVFKSFFDSSNFSKTKIIAQYTSTKAAYPKDLYYQFSHDSVDSLAKTPINVAINDSLMIDLTARFAENYYGNAIGRIFFPLSNYPSQFKYRYGNGSMFPIVPAIDSAIKHMAVGDELEICGQSWWGYGDEGFNDSYYNIIAVPAYTSVHYKIRLLGHRKSDIWTYAE